MERSSESFRLQQHRAIKEKYPDAIVLLPAGEVYEVFGLDASIVSDTLKIPLLKKGDGKADSSERLIFPRHMIDDCQIKLIRAGYRVAVCTTLDSEDDESEGT